MHGESSSPGVSGHKSGPCRWSLTTRDGVRQGRQGPFNAGTGGKGSAEKLSNWAGTPKAAQLNLYRRNK